MVKSVFASVHCANRRSSESMSWPRFSMIAFSALKISSSLELLDLLLNLVLLGEHDRLPRLTPQGLDLLLGVQECLFCGKHRVVFPPPFEIRPRTVMSGVGQKRPLSKA